MTTISVYDYIRSLAQDWEAANSTAVVLSNAQIDLLIARFADAEGQFNLGDVAIEYCRAAKYKAADLTPERAAAFRMREEWLLRERLGGGWQAYQSTASGGTGLVITQGGGGLDIDNPIAGLPVVYDATDEAYKTEQLGSPGLADDAVHNRNLAIDAVEADNLAQGAAAGNLAEDTGNRRVDAQHIRNIATEIDRELGSNAWRTGGGGTSVGLTASQVDARIAAEVADFAEEGNTADRLPYNKTPQRLNDTLELREQVELGLELAVFDELFDQHQVITGAAWALLAFNPGRWTLIPNATWMAGAHYDFWNLVDTAFIIEGDDARLIPISTRGGTIVESGPTRNSIMRRIAEGGIVTEPAEKLYIGRTASNEILIGFNTTPSQRWNIDRLTAKADFITPENRLVPARGTSGQLLAKKSAADYDTEWRDVNIPQPRSSAPAPNQFGVAGLAGISQQYARGDHRHGTPAAPSGGGGGLDQAAVDARVAAGVQDWAEAGNTDNIPAGKLGNAVTSVTSDDSLKGSGTTASPLGVVNPPDKRLLDFDRHGLTGDGQTQQAGLIAQHLGDKPTHSNLEAYTYTTFYDPGPLFTNQWAGIRIPIADKPAVDHYELYVSESDGGNRYALYQGKDWEHIGDTGAYAYYTVQVSDKPSGQGLSVWQYQRLGLDLTDVAVDYRGLENLPNLQDGRELFNGAMTGLVITSLDGNSAVATTNLTEALNVNTEPHGVLLALLTPSVNGFAATDVAFAAGRGKQ